MSMVDAKVGTAFASTDWTEYRKARPEYPQSLTDIIYDYRRVHNVGWNRIVDLGSGVGLALTNFAPEFTVLHVSDPSPPNLEKARGFMTDWLKHSGIERQLEYSLSVGETACEHVGIAHLMDPDGLATSAAKILRPGGTLAIYSYWLPCFPDKSETFNDTFIRAVGITTQSSTRAVDAATRELFRHISIRVKANVTSGTGGLDFLPLLEEYFEDRQRIRINASNSEMLYNGLIPTVMHVEGEPAPSRVSESEKILDYYTGRDLQAEGWSVNVDKQWLYNFLNTLRGADNPISEAEKKTLFQGWEQVYQQECSEGPVGLYGQYILSWALVSDGDYNYSTIPYRN